MKEKLNIFLLAVGAGLAISMGGTVYLTLENKVIGSLLFTVGLYTIVLNGLRLYTGAVGYFVTAKNKKGYTLELAAIWLGNLVGTMLGASLILLTRAKILKDVAIKVCEIKLADNPLSIFILAIFCGILMFVAVDGFKQTKQPILLFLCVSAFILAGFEHCIANMYYFTMAGAWSLKTVLYLFIMTIGNSVGGMLIPTIKHVVKERE